MKIDFELLYEIIKNYLLVSKFINKGESAINTKMITTVFGRFIK
ncbi:MAG: hypothetical protein ACKN91_05500 [Candidatus Fonsibacter sp.]